MIEGMWLNPGLCVQSELLFKLWFHRGLSFGRVGVGFKLGGVSERQTGVLGCDHSFG